MAKVLTIVFAATTILFGALYIGVGDEAARLRLALDEATLKQQSAIEQAKAAEAESLRAKTLAEEARRRAGEAMREAQTEREKTEADLRKAERNIDVLETRVDELIASLAETRARLRDESDPKPVADASPDEPEDGDAPEKKDDAFSGFRKSMGEMMSDPKMREMIVAQQRAMLDGMYGGFFDELGLGGEEREAVKEILLQAQLEMMDVGGKLMSLDRDSPEWEKASSEARERSRAVEDALRETLGDEPYERFEVYRDSAMDRMFLNNFVNQGSGADMPVDADQRRQLERIILDETAAADFTVSQGDFRESPAEALTKEKVEKFLEERKAFNDRVLEKSKAVLGEDQHDRYAEFMERMEALQESQMEMARRMFRSDDEDDKTDTPTGDGEAPDAE